MHSSWWWYDYKNLPEDDAKALRVLRKLKGLAYANKIELSVGEAYIVEQMLEKHLIEKVESILSKKSTT